MRDLVTIPVHWLGKDGTYTQAVNEKLWVAENSRLGESGTSTWPCPDELKLKAYGPGPTRPVVQETLPTSVPVWPFPVSSAVVVPLSSLKFHSATRPF